MEFALSEEQQAIFEMSRSFADENLAPKAIEWDETGHFPEDVVRSVGELGLAGIYVKEDVGGSGLGRLDATLVFEGLAYGCPSIASFISIHNKKRLCFLYNNVCRCFFVGSVCFCIIYKRFVPSFLLCDHFYLWLSS